jgi:hypothetical protein
MRPIPPDSAAILLAIAASTGGVAAAQTPTVPDDLIVTLERTSCFGECPIYSVNIDALGNVVYNGTKFVRVDGRQTGRIPPSRVAAIAETAERIGFFELHDRYRSIRNPDGTTTEVTDLPTTFVTITRDGRTKRVEDYVGAPDGLRQLERQIDEAAHTKQWISLDESTMEKLVGQGWRPGPEELPELLRKALGQDEITVVKGLIDLGADPNRLYYGTRTTPLMMVRSAAAARLLIEAGANPNMANDNGFTPLGRSIYLSPDVANVLLKAGARVDEPTGGATALWSAACGGNVGVVSLLLDAGADPTVRGRRDRHAGACARKTSLDH